jgi:hemimethylated DNA binding protein
VLRHRKFGFRAAVFGWERRPQLDVSQWDGVKGLPSGAQQPFYRMVPDIASHRIASHRIASHRTASHRIA